MVGAHTIRGGRYKCDFCDHTSYKTVAGIQAHLKDQHLHSLRLAEKDAEIERLKGLLEKWLEVDIRHPGAALKIAELHLRTQSFLTQKQNTIQP